MPSRPQAPTFLRGTILLERWYDCNRKVRYRTKEKAEAAIKETGRPLEVYDCQYCGCWHLGRKKGLVKDEYYND